MGGQLCGYSNGEALSRWCAAIVGANALSDFATAPQWAQHGMADWVDRTEDTDQDPDSVGCGMAFLSWLMSQGHTLSQTAKAMVKLGDERDAGRPLRRADRRYRPSDAWANFNAAVQALPEGVNSDDPFDALGTAAARPDPTAAGALRYIHRSGHEHRREHPPSSSPLQRGPASTQSLTVTDNRTGRSYELPITDSTIKSMDLRQIKVSEDDFGLMAYDPAYTNTASCRSQITYIDGDKGTLEYRGYPIEELCAHSSFPRGRLFADPRPASEEGRARRVGLRGDDPHVRAREHQGLHAGLSLRRQSDGHAGGIGRGPLDLLSGGRPDRRYRVPQPADHPAAREAAYPRRLRLPPQQRTALCLSRQ